MNKLKLFLEHTAYNMRVSSLIMTSMAGSGHPTSALSAADIVAGIFFYGMRYDPKNPNNPNNDRFILSKGHASPIFYAVWKELGILSESDLLTYRKMDSVLEGHPTLRFPYTEAATGSLGMGLSFGAGMALSAKMDKRNFHTFVLLGDSEIAEGSVWEAAELAAYYKLDNLVGIVDCNRLGQTGETMHGYHVHRYEEKFHAFGWKVIIIDGHDMQQVMGAIDKARATEGHPTMIIAKTVKGYGVSSVEDKNGFHGKVFPKDDLNSILADLEKKFSLAASFDADKQGFSWKPNIPEAKRSAEANVNYIHLPEPRYQEAELIATRRAYGQALQALGSVSKAVVSLDAEVKNSTYAQLFEKKYPDRFIQCFIAEQNMVGMGVGLDRRGKIPFISTFGAFFSRAHDQIRMAAVGNARLHLVGSHCGVSIGQDGPSQMALEDIAMMRALPASVVLYPSDAVSTHALVQEMVNYQKGISYLRTTRMATPVIYKNNQEFKIGGCNVIHESESDKVCVVGAGITLHEAIKAHDQLQLDGVNIAVIDCYSIKPLDVMTIEKLAKASGNKIITVEDHYLEGGLGQAVTYEMRNSGIRVECLAVHALPRSGKPEELLAWAGIDAAGIVKKVRVLL